MATAASIMSRARTLLQDESSVRWPLPELCNWLNDGLREIRTVKPELFGEAAVLTLAAGVKQAIPSAYERLLKVDSNARTDTSDRRARQVITVVDRDLLNTVVPGWTDERRRKQQVVHVMFDEREPSAFYVWPANDGTGTVNAVLVRPHSPVAVTPTDADPNDITKYPTVVPIDDVYANALVDYVLYRAYAKDAQFSASAERAGMYAQMFARTVGIEVAQDAATSPNAKAGLPRASTGVATTGGAAANA